MATNMVDVLDMTEDELEAELLRQLENMSEDEDEEQQLNYNNNNKTNILKKYEDEENVPLLICITTFTTKCTTCIVLEFINVLR